jgi:phosphoribosylformylglycinamidine (FGAM) synthase-like enzyme
MHLSLTSRRIQFIAASSCVVAFISTPRTLLQSLPHPFHLVTTYIIAHVCRDAMIELECACDGGKDSLSMAAAAGGETVMAPGNLVVSAYVGCPDITKVVTPDLKLAGAGGVLLHVDLASVPGARRLGGSALAQAYNQVGFVWEHMWWQL